jgi:hypothetical protein
VWSGDLPDCTNVKEFQLRSSGWAPDGEGVAYINEDDGGNIWEQPFDGRAHRLAHDEAALTLQLFLTREHEWPAKDDPACQTGP